MTCDHKLTNHNVNQFQPITAVHSQITTCEVKGYVTTVGDILSVLAGFIANLTLTDSVNIDLCGRYSSNITCLLLLVCGDSEVKVCKLVKALRGKALDYFESLPKELRFEFEPMCDMFEGRFGRQEAPANRSALHRE